MSENGQDERLLQPEATRELIFSRVTRSNPIFERGLPFQTDSLDSISMWAKGALRTAVAEASPYKTTSVSGRSLILQLDFSDQIGRRFGYLDIKGGGLTTRGNRFVKIPTSNAFPDVNEHDEPWGASYLSNCESEFDKGIEFDSWGVRIGVPVMVLAISPDDPELKLFLEKNYDLKDEEFGVIVRAMRSPHRLSELVSGNNREEYKRLILDGAIGQLADDGLIENLKLQSAENEKEKLQLYFKTLAYVTGLNLGKIHNKGFWIGNRTSENTTLAGELVDLGDGAEVGDSIRRKKMAPKIIFDDIFMQGKVMHQLEIADYAKRNQDRLGVKPEFLISDYIQGYKTGNKNMLSILRKAWPNVASAYIKGVFHNEYGGEWSKKLITGLLTRST